MYGTGFGDNGAVSVCELENLKDLTADNCPITDKGVEHLAKPPSLEILSLHGTQVTDACLEHLGNLKKLRGLSVKETRVTPEAWAKFKQEHPNIKDGAIMEFHSSKVGGGMRGGR